MTLYSTDNVFLGVVVQPKTKQPVYVIRPLGTNKTAAIWAAGYAGEDRIGVYSSVGRGYLEEKGGDPDYVRACTATGLPRSHTPAGVLVRGGGFGTCLYTGLVLLAVAAHDRKLHVTDLCGDGYGISSDSKSRSKEADGWWKAMLDRGITEQIESEGEETTEELEDEDVGQYVSQPGWRSIQDAVSDALSNYSEWGLARLRDVRADLERSTTGDAFTADIYTMDAAEAANLVAVTDVAEGDLLEWAKQKPFRGKGYKESILALNVAREDSLLVARLALIAREAGATEREVMTMLMRNRFGRDVHLRGQAPPLFPARQIDVELERAQEAREHAEARERARRERERELSSGKKKLPPETEPGVATPNPAPIPIRRRNQEAPSPAQERQLERDLSELERRREDLGWTELEDLP